MFVVLPMASQELNLELPAASGGLWRGFYFWFLFYEAQGLPKPVAN